MCCRVGVEGLGTDLPEQAAASSKQEAMGKSKRWRADFSSGFSETATELSAAAQTARVHRGEVDAGLRTVLGSGRHVRDLANYVTSLGRIQEDARRLERLTNCRIVFICIRTSVSPKALV